MMVILISKLLASFPVVMAILNESTRNFPSMPQAPQRHSFLVIHCLNTSLVQGIPVTGVELYKMHGSVLLCCNFKLFFKYPVNVLIHRNGESLFPYIAYFNSIQYCCFSAPVIDPSSCNPSGHYIKHVIYKLHLEKLLQHQTLPIAIFFWTIILIILKDSN
jgi:hypothetical protein